MAQNTLDPDDWDHFRMVAHTMLDDALDTMESTRDRRVWTPLPDELKSDLQSHLPRYGMDLKAVQQKLAALLPYGVGNTHPRFFGWVHGSGNPGNILAEMAGAAMNANLGGRDHGAIYVEKQVLKWCRQMLGFPEGASGLIVSGTSMATIIALKVARDQRLGGDCRKKGITGTGLAGYASAQAHSCIGRAFDLLGLGSNSLRPIACDSNYQMDAGALKKAIAHDREQGFIPFLVVGTAGSVNVGAIDNLSSLAEIAHHEKLWFHVDGAFGAALILSTRLRKRLAGIERADSVAFDFHKWLHVNYDAGCVVIRSQTAHLQAFTGRPEYLAEKEQGLAAGSPWPVDYGPELSRGFRALKIWAHLLEHGVDKLAAAIETNCAQAAYLGRRIEDSSKFELLAPVLLNIVCFRYVPARSDDLDELNGRIVTTLQELGIAAPSTTVLQGKAAIRVNITNHRTEIHDLDMLLEEAEKIGDQISGQSRFL